MNLLSAIAYSPSLIAAHHHDFPFRVSWSVQPLLALVAGVLILVRPKLLNFIVAIYLIVIGLLGVFHWA